LHNFILTALQYKKSPGFGYSIAAKGGNLFKVCITDQHKGGTFLLLKNSRLVTVAKKTVIVTYTTVGYNI